MGTDSKYLEEAMAEVEAIFGTFSNNAEINSLTINNLESRLDNVCVDKPYADIQGEHLEVFSLFNRELTGDSFNGYYVQKWVGCQYINRKVELDLLFKKINKLEKGFENDEYIFGNIAGTIYRRYYKNHNIDYDLFTGSVICVGSRCVHELSRDTKGKVVRNNGNCIRDSLRKNKVTAKDIETGKKVYKYVVTYESKPILVEDTGHYITLETGCYKWVEE